MRKCLASLRASVPLPEAEGPSIVIHIPVKGEELGFVSVIRPYSATANAIRLGGIAAAPTIGAPIHQTPPVQIRELFVHF